MSHLIEGASNDCCHLFWDSVEFTSGAMAPTEVVLDALASGRREKFCRKDVAQSPTSSHAKASLVSQERTGSGLSCGRVNCLDSDEFAAACAKMHVMTSRSDGSEGPPVQHVRALKNDAPDAGQKERSLAGIMCWEDSDSQASFAGASDALDM